MSAVRGECGIFAGIFLENIRQKNGTEGILIGKKGLRTSTFPNDTTKYIGNNSSLTYLEMQLTHFEEAIGIKYNKTKCM